MNLMEKIYTVKEAAELLKTTRNFIYNEINEGKLKAIKIGTMKIRESDLEDYIKKLDD